MLEAVEERRLTPAGAPELPFVVVRADEETPGEDRQALEERDSYGEYREQERCDQEEDTRAYEYINQDPRHTSEGT